MMKEKIKLPIVVGPTASGKSALALRVAQEYGCEIVSCDSMQIYRRMNIGTAKPTKEEMSLVRHHMINIVEPWESFSCADYAVRARACIDDILARGKMPLVVGGTGLYLDALLRGGLCEEADSDAAYRDELLAIAAEKGNEYVYNMLAEIDPVSAAASHPNNLRRVVRALEIYHVTGVPKSEMDKRKASFDGVFEPLAVGLFHADRQALYDRIDLRVDSMMREGLLDEVKALAQEKLSSTAAGAIGYKELFGFLRGEMTLAEAVEDLKRGTRRYAKRQLTWFGAKEYVNRIEVADESFEEIVKKAKKVFQFA